MNVLKQIKEHIVTNLKIISLWNVREHFTFRHYLKIVFLLFLNLVTAIAKILTPATTAKAMEMIALSQEEYPIGPFNLKPSDLLYLSIVLMVWIKSEMYIKRFIVREFEQLQVDKNVMKFIAASHNISYEKHLEVRPLITKTTLEIINYQSKLVSEVMVNISQSLLDIIIGNILIWQRYGRFLGGEFLIYCAIDIFLLSYFVDWVTNHSQVFNRLDKALHKFINHEFEILSYEETVRIFNHQELETRLSKKLLNNYLQKNSRFLLVEDIASVVKIIPLIIANIIPVSYMFKENLSLHDLDDFIFLVSYINLFGGSIAVLNQSIKTCKRAVESLDRQKEFHQQNTCSELNEIKSNLPLLLSMNGSPLIEFKEVVFTYPNFRTPVLNKMTFTLKPGETVGIIGRSNAGKSTITKLLFGLYKPQSGSIKLNGHDINEIPKSVLAKIFCCVPQNAELFRNKSIKYNVLYGMDDDDLIYNIVEKKSPPPEKQPNYRTIDIELNERGPSIEEESEANQQFSQAMIKVNLSSLVNAAADNKSSTTALSGGQRQRVGIARTLVRNSAVFIFDESSSALDSFTESTVLANIKCITKNKTTLMITHRLSTVRDVDQVLVIENGQVVEQGNPNELLDRRGVFYQYLQMQHH